MKGNRTKTYPYVLIHNPVSEGARDSPEQDSTDRQTDRQTDSTDKDRIDLREALLPSSCTVLHSETSTSELP